MKKYFIVILLLSLFLGCDDENESPNVKVVTGLNEKLWFDQAYTDSAHRLDFQQVWPEYGNECPCSNLWGEGKTPKYVTVVFSDMVGCGDPDSPPTPNEQPFVLEQQLQAGRWALYNEPEFDYTVEWYPTRGEIVCATMMGHVFFHQVGPIPPAGECVAFFDNSICYCSEPPEGPFQSEGGTAWVSWQTDSDLNGDGVVNLTDYVLFSNSWDLVEGDSGYDARCDFTQDGCVDEYDLAVFVDNWLERRKVLFAG